MGSVRAALIGLLTAGSLAAAGPLVFYGQDAHNDEHIRIGSHPNADLARGAFVAGLSNLGFEGLETQPEGPGPTLDLDFGNGVTAVLDVLGEIEDIATGTDGFGRYPTEGTRFLNDVVATESIDIFLIEFSRPVTAFGFYAVDVGDWGDQLKVRFIHSPLESTLLSVPHPVGSGLHGNVLFYGLQWADKPFSKVEVINASEDDAFGFDAFQIGDPGVVPEPGSLAILAGGAMALYRRRKR